MSLRLALVALMLAAPAAAAPLCHDIRGLYTPCPPGTPAAQEAARKKHSAPAPSQPAAKGRASGDAAPAAKAAPAPAAVAAAPAKPETFAHSRKLCRDTKGLYTPCPR